MEGFEIGDSTLKRIKLNVSRSLRGRRNSKMLQSRIIGFV